MDAGLTFLDALVCTLTEAGAYNSLEMVAPAAVLWPDAAREWEPLLPLLRERLPVLTLGTYAPDEATGPAPWLRCMVAHAIGDGLATDHIPVVYLPGVSGKELEHVDRLPKELALLADLRFRGNVWAHHDGTDWTPLDYLRGKQRGLNVEVLTDAETHKALVRALPVLAGMTIAQLRAEVPWKAKDFDALLGFQTQPQEPSIPELIARGESAQLEFKATARTDVETGQKLPALEQVIVKTVAAFLNSAHGGTLLIGVNDDGSIRGIEDDYKAWSKPQDRNRDKYELWLMKLLQDAYGKQFGPYIRVTFHTIEGKDVCRVTVAPAPQPVFVKEGNDERFYVRMGNSSPWLKISEALDYIKTRWS